ncbi:MAG TPA: S41 family peptidase [Chitinophagaceae bacterium]
MKLFFTINLFLISVVGFAQDCNCGSEYDYVVSYFEANSPAFQKIKSNAQAYSDYNKAEAQLRMKAKAETDHDHCIVYLDEYVSLLKDHHSGIGFNLKRKDLGSDEKISSFKTSDTYQQFRKLKIDTTEILSNYMSKEVSDIEGIYTDGRSIQFAVIKDATHKDRYAGVILKPNKLLDPGHVLLEFTAKENNHYDVVYNVGLLGFNLNRLFKNIVIENGQMPAFGFSKITGSRPGLENYSFKSLDDKTNYLQLQSFDYRLTNELDSFYTSINDAIKSKPYLVIDLRNNGGGSEGSYLKLLPYAYTKPLSIDSAVVWVSPENIKRYEESGRPNDSVLIKRMKAAKPYSFISQAEDAIYSWALDSSTVYPKKIALLYNRGTASSAEGMILYYMQSDKVTTMGEPSGGFMGYGNVMSVPTPCGKFTIQCTTIMYAEKSKYEFTGIEPNVKLTKEQDWVQYARDWLNK